jgi:hypothetical protein
MRLFLGSLINRPGHAAAGAFGASSCSSTAMCYSSTTTAPFVAEARLQQHRRCAGRRQDKGHNALVAAFIQAIKHDGPRPIPTSDLLEVSRVAIDAAGMARDGGGSASYAARREL